MFGTLSNSQVTQELNNRGYLQEIDETITPIITLPSIPDTSNGSFISKYGMLTALAFVGMFLLAIFPGQTDEV